MTAVNPDNYHAAWSRSSRLQGIKLLYRKTGTRSWSTATNVDGTFVTFPFAVASVCAFLVTCGNLTFEW